MKGAWVNIKTEPSCITKLLTRHPENPTDEKATKVTAVFSFLSLTLRKYLPKDLSASKHRS